jgi:hypothetical protein
MHTAKSRKRFCRVFPAAQGAGRNGRPLLLAVGAQGIAAEIPQTRRRRVEELERKARFFAALPQKMRPNSFTGLRKNRLQ